MNNYESLKTFLPLEYFKEISKIPRGSGNEAKIADYLCEFAKSHGLEYFKDGANNVFIKKNATQGRENEDAILLQAHTDMVCEKNVSSDHDFMSEPIKLIFDGNILKADGTTLGADDGYGVAIIMAILSDASVSHPRLECLFTSSEETGLVGASKFDYSMISAKNMVNFDGAEEDTVIIGCCGGVRTEFTYPIVYEETSLPAYEISVRGLYGGHSGEDINKGRLNANTLMGKILGYVKERSPIRVAKISGGDKDNAIPRECDVTIVTSYPLCDIENEISSYARSFLVADEDKELTVQVKKSNTSRAFSEKATLDLIKVLSIQNGVLQTRQTPPILPKMSRNLARTRTNEDNFSIGFSSRAYLEPDLNSSTSELDSLAKEIGATTLHHEGYPGWESPKDSPLARAWAEAYCKKTNTSPEITLIHAGLECGIITSSVKGLTAISVGCNVHDLHTPNETMEIDSFERIYRVALEFLKSFR